MTLEDLLAARPGPLAIAVSGGLDSLTLMALAHRVRDRETIAVHGVSAAVPPEATERVTALGRDLGWTVRMVEAGEFADPNYLSNPVNRCYFCKSNLFATMARAAPGATLATGTNTDDLGDFRPGLAAARENAVWQPYVEAGVSKDAIRALARAEGLPEVAALPAQPCLASRIETGIPVTAQDLAFAHRIERMLWRAHGPGDHRARITARGVVVQTGADVGADLRAKIRAACAETGRAFAGVEAYRKGSAFLTEGR